MRLVSTHKVILTEEDIARAVWHYLNNNSLELDLPQDAKDLNIASNINLKANIEISWTRAAGDDR